MKRKCKKCNWQGKGRVWGHRECPLHEQINFGEGTQPLYKCPIDSPRWYIRAIEKVKHIFRRTK